MARLGQETGRGRGEEGRWFHKTAPSPELGWVGSGQMEPQGSVMNDGAGRVPWWSKVRGGAERGC